jgi:hypothetical protein
VDGNIFARTIKLCEILNKVITGQKEKHVKLRGGHQWERDCKRRKLRR